MVDPKMTRLKFIGACCLAILIALYLVGAVSVTAAGKSQSLLARQSKAAPS